MKIAGFKLTIKNSSYDESEKKRKKITSPRITIIILGEHCPKLKEVF